jgi:hypothetical protein
MAFTLYHAHQTPKLDIIEIKKEQLSNGLTSVIATIRNERIIPTHSAHDMKFKIERPDYISIKGCKVLAGMLVENEDLNIFVEQKTAPETIEVPNIEGMGIVKVKWIVKGNSSGTIQVSSAKGGVVEKEF